MYKFISKTKREDCFINGKKKIFICHTYYYLE